MDNTFSWIINNKPLQIFGIYKIGVQDLKFRIEIFLNLVEISSLICLFLTITVYLYVNKLRNQLGKCLVMFLFCRLVTQLYLSFLLPHFYNLPKGICLAAGYTVYFFVMAAELWSTAFSHNVWKGLKAVHRNDPGNRFLAYNIFAWGIAASLTALIFLLDYSFKYSFFLPGVGLRECWFYTPSLATTIYIQWPISAMDAYKVIVFTLTAFHIAKVKRDIRRFSPNDEMRTKVKSDNKNFLMLLRLFSIMALSWSLTILQWLTNGDIQMAVEVVYIYFHLSFGVIIFALFILKRSTLRLLMERIRSG